MTRPRLRQDGVPTRADMKFWTRAERLIYEAAQEVEHMGASVALTDAVTLLARARDRVADHVEGSAEVARDALRQIGALPTADGDR